MIGNSKFKITKLSLKPLQRNRFFFSSSVSLSLLIFCPKTLAWPPKVSLRLRWTASLLLSSKFLHFYINLCKRKFSLFFFFFSILLHRKENRERNRVFIFDSPWSSSRLTVYICFLFLSLKTKNTFKFRFLHFRSFLVSLPVPKEG